MKKLETIIIHRKVDTPLTLDLTDFVFLPDSELVFTIKKDEYSEALIERVFTEPIKYDFSITPEEAKVLVGNLYHYDFVLVGEEKIKQCLISDVQVEGTIYGN